MQVDSNTFRLDILNTQTKYVPVGGSASIIHSVHLKWDATVAAAITFEDTNLPPELADIASTTAGEWIAESTVTITGPAVAAGGTMVHLGNYGARRGRFKVVATGSGAIDFIAHGKT